MNEVEKERLKDWKKRTAKSLKKAAKDAVNILIPVVGLLMILEQPYSPFITGQFLGDSNSWKRWKMWRKRKDMAPEILETIDMSMKKVKKAYGYIADFGYLDDPLSHWYPLLELIKRSKKEKLAQKARLAQEYYELARMIKYFIKDLTNEEMLDPDDRWDSNHAYWEPRAYGSPFNYDLPKTQKLIRDDYFIDRPPLISIVFEGKTEEIVIKKILELFVIDPNREGYHLYNAEGSGNLGARNLDALIDLAKSNEMDVYLIIDNDEGARSTLDRHKALGNIKDDMFTIWNKDFEYDNFGPEKIVKKVNQMLRSRGLNTVLIKDVKRRMVTNQDVLMKALDNVIRKNNNGKKLDDVVSKK
ncbi:MAG: TOPRIM nucleotidyl transferase/hydrolase domain-containing protein, partial [Nitrososphaeraceae archaeon]